LSVNMDMFGRQMEIRLVDKTIYLKRPESPRGQADPAKPWTKISIDDSTPAGKALSENYGELAAQNDPSQMLEQIQKAGTIKKSEATTLDGEPANHYTFDLDLAKLADLMPAGLPAEAKTQLEGKDIHFPMDVWVNSDQLPMQTVMAMSSLGGAQLGSMKVTRKYTDWGVAVDITAPPADQIAEPK
jgi:hypothetical protein